MDKNTIEKILNAALDELYEKDQKLIFNEQFKGNRTHCHSSERSIVHKYAIYFEKLIINELSNIMKSKKYSQLNDFVGKMVKK